MEQFNLYFVDILKNKYAAFSGRARRKEFWMFLLFQYLVVFVVSFVFALIKLPFVGTLVAFTLFIPSLALAVRRVQDCGKDWWYILIPIYNIILYCTEGEKGTNKFGPDPKA